jgi:hypothetical protein
MPLPLPRPVILNYHPSHPFGPNPRQVKVAPNDTIHFAIGIATRILHQGCRLRITLHDAQHFSPGVLEHASSDVNAQELVFTVLPGIATSAGSVITGYKCELLDASGVPIPGLSSDGTTGGDIVPDTGSN